jgi:penicillin amidase
MDFKQFQSDDLSLYHLELLKILHPVIDNAGLTDPLERQIVEQMGAWNGDMKTGYAESAVMSVWIQRLLWNILHDELGDNLYNTYLELHSTPLSTLNRLLEKSDSPWFDNTSTKDKNESKTELITISFQESISEIKTRQGADHTKWSWGSMHTLTLEHPLGSNPLLRSAFNLGPFPVAGAAMTVNCQGYRLNKPFHVAWAPAARIIVDLNNLDNVISVLPSGQSGQVLDEHFRDQLQLYTNNLYHPSLMDTVKIIHSGWNHLTLK